MSRLLTIIFILFSVSVLSATSEVRWFEGTKAAAPQGKLLTPNVDYWGNNISTGVTYQYETGLTGVADTPDDEKAFSGRRLFDGIEPGWYRRPSGPTLQTSGSVVFDFKRKCKFTEIDILTETTPVRFQIEVSSDKVTWKTAYDSIQKTPSKTPLRWLPLRCSGRYLRLKVEADGNVNISEAWVWGDTRMSEKDYAASGLPSALDLIKADGLPGIASTKVSADDYAKWSAELYASDTSRAPAVWSKASPWKSLATAPILPNRSLINKPIETVVCRNESEPIAVYLTNTSRNRVRTLDVKLSGFVDANGVRVRSITGELYVFGVQQSWAHGATPYVLISSNNKPGRDLLRKYCLNGTQIMDFPTVRLSHAGSAIFWVKVRTNNCKPGKYTAQLSYKGGPSITLTANVVDVTLPNPKVWVNYWTHETNMMPFRPVDWVDREAIVRHELGMTVVAGVSADEDGWPWPGTGAEALYKLDKQVLFKIWGMGRYGHILWSAKNTDGGFGVKDFTPEMQADLTNILKSHVETAKKLGMDYSQWFIESGDEPNPKNFRLFGEMARVCREADPNVMIYINPCGWLGLPEKLVEDDSTMYPGLKDWYNKYIDISVPGFLHLDGSPNSHTLYTAPRAYNALYDVMGDKTRSDASYSLINYPRYLAWKAIEHGLNGWGYYSTYQPRSNPWDDTDNPECDYQTIFPGPNGPIISRGSEASGEAAEDYKLFYLLKQRKPDIHASLVKKWQLDGNYDNARTQAIRALTNKTGE